MQGGTGPQSNNADGSSACKFTLSEAGDVSSISWYGKLNSGSGNLKCVIYADSSGYPGAVKGVTNAIVITTTEQWWTATFAVAVSLTAGTYWLAWTSDSSTAYYYNTGTTNQRYSVSDTYSDGVADPYPAGGTGQARVISIYATYTASGGSGTLIPVGMAGGVRELAGGVRG